MRLNFIQSLIIVCMVALATQITRWTPFLLFSGERKLPRVVEDLGKLLPPDGAIFGLSRFAGGASGFQGSAASSPHAEAPNK